SSARAASGPRPLPLAPAPRAPRQSRTGAMRWARLALLLGTRCGLGGADAPSPGQRCNQARGGCRPLHGAAARPEAEPPPPARGRRLSATRAAPQIADESCLVVSDSSGGLYMLGVGQNVSLSPDQVSTSQGGSRKGWALVTIDGSTLECRDTRNASAEDACAEYLGSQGCGWTKNYGCPGQAKGASGDAEDDGSVGYLCCCTKEAWKQEPGTEAATQLQVDATVGAGTAAAPDTTPGATTTAADADAATAETTTGSDSTSAATTASAASTAPDTSSSSAAAPADAAAVSTTVGAGSTAPDTTAAASSSNSSSSSGSSSGSTAAAADAAAGGTTAGTGSTAPDTTTGAGTTAADAEADTTADGTEDELEGKALMFGGAVVGRRGRAGAWGAGPAGWASLAGAALLAAALAVVRGRRAPAERYAALDEANVAMLQAGSSDDGF
ncbi:unnamed protein product, partial [Prorocentrum cordatum]